jgi:hypothetical protein
MRGFFDREFYIDYDFILEIGILHLNLASHNIENKNM